MAEEKKSGIDRRVDTRAPFLILEIQGTHSNKIFLAQTENVSKGGLFFSPGQSFKVGDSFPIEFVLPDNKTTVRCMSEVVWKKSYDKSGYPTEGVGIRFVDLDEAQKRVVGEWIDREEANEQE